MIRFLICFIGLLTMALLIIIWSFKNRISPMPSSLAMRKTLFASLEDCSGKRIVDLGSGWGHLIVGMARKFPKAFVTGYENSPLPFLFSFLLKGKLPVSVKMQDFFTADLKAADVVLCYLCPYSMEKLGDKFTKELPESAQVISLVFAIPGWKPDKVIYADDLYRSPIYFYKRNR